MAQWLGQFTGKTHRTAVLDAEQLLEHAVAVLRAADHDERPRKAKAVRALAKRVYSARLRFLKARFQSATRATSDNGQKLDSDAPSRLEGAIATLIRGGVAAILAELGAQDLLSQPKQ